MNGINQAFFWMNFNIIHKHIKLSKFVPCWTILGGLPYWSIPTCTSGEARVSQLWMWNIWHIGKSVSYVLSWVVRLSPLPMLPKWSFIGIPYCFNKSWWLICWEGEQPKLQGHVWCTYPQMNGTCDHGPLDPLLDDDKPKNFKNGEIDKPNLKKMWPKTYG